MNTRLRLVVALAGLSLAFGCGGSGGPSGMGGSDSGMASNPDSGMASNPDSGMASNPDSGMASNPDSGMGGGDSGTLGADSGTAGMPGPGAYEADYKTSSGFFTRTSVPFDSGSVHGTVRIWYSTNVMDLPTSGPFVAPVGTVAIKEEYDGMGAVLVKVVMIKKPAGYDPANHDWYYEARNPDDSLATDPTPGPAPLCISCHQNAADTTDYLQGFAVSS